MIDFSLTDEQQHLQKVIKDFARKELNDDIAGRDKKAEFSTALWSKCAAMDIMALPFPSEYGGCGLDFLTTTAAIEAFSYACKDSGLVHAVCTQLISGLLLNIFGNEDQKRQYLPLISRGEAIAAQAITEADSGSDALSMLTKAIKSGAQYVLDGRKMFITNGSIADLIFVLALTDPGRKTMGAHSFFLCEKERAGLSRGNPFEKMGLRTLQNCEIIFDSCGLPAANLVGREGQGAIIFNEMMEWERILFGACHLGNLTRIIETCVRYAKDRKQFGQPIGKFQSISNKIARMKINQELIRPLVYQAASHKDNNRRAAMEASIIKVFASESLKSACLDAVQIHGAYGYMTEFEIERDLRDSIAATIYSGTVEMNLLIIAKLLGL
jgi:alkylation response protein AidB-like acyl-CoA dehydrogenase